MAGSRQGVLWDGFRNSPGAFKVHNYSGDFCGTPPPAGEPTSEPPGSPGKLLVLQARAAQGVALFHPLDYCPDLERASTVARLLPREFAGGVGGIYSGPFGA
jgi:hypothetical protein